MKAIKRGIQALIAGLVLLVVGLLLQPWEPVAWGQDYVGGDVDVAFRLLGFPTMTVGDGEHVWVSPINIFGLSISARQLVIAYSGSRSCVVSQKIVFRPFVVMSSDLERDVMRQRITLAAVVPDRPSGSGSCASDLVQ